MTLLTIAEQAFHKGVSDRRDGLPYCNTYTMSDEGHRAYNRGYGDPSSGEATVES